jgi:hypothetical protein
MPNKLFVAIPCYGQMPTPTVQSLLDFQANPPCPIEIKIRSGCADIGLVRDQLTSDFLESDCTHLLFIDADMVFTSDNAARLLRHNVDIVGGFYPKKRQGDIVWVLNTKADKINPLGTGLQEVRNIGTGFLLIARRVFERIIELRGKDIAYETDSTPPKPKWAFWVCGVHQFQSGLRRRLGEDWMFCEKWIEIGGKLYADATVVVRHHGGVIFPLKSQLPATIIPTRNTN